jgi:hypothetical protein
MRTVVIGILVCCAGGASARDLQRDPSTVPLDPRSLEVNLICHGDPETDSKGDEANVRIDGGLAKFWITQKQAGGASGTTDMTTDMTIPITRLTRAEIELNNHKNGADFQGGIIDRLNGITSVSYGKDHDFNLNCEREPAKF